MKRDNDLSRAILIFVQDHCPPQGVLRESIVIEGYDATTVIAHAELLIEDDYIDGGVTKFISNEPHAVHIIKLTNRGHDAIAATQNDETWKTVKKTALEKGVSLTFELAVNLAKRLAASHLGM